MYIAPLQDVLAPPSVGQILGTTGAQEILERINNSYGPGVIFGQIGDPFANHFNLFMNGVVNVMNQTGKLIETAKNAILNNEPIHIIKNDEDLFNMPACMRIPVLTMPEVRSLLKDEKIDGWGLEDCQLPKEDIVGRLAETNGFVWLNHRPEGAAAEFTWEWKSTDPKYTLEELDALAMSRQYVRSYLKRACGPDGDRRDFTDPNGIGTIRR